MAQPNSISQLSGAATDLDLSSRKGENDDVNNEEEPRGRSRSKCTSASALLGLVKSRFKHLKDGKDTASEGDGVGSRSAGDVSVKCSASSASIEVPLPHVSHSTPVFSVPSNDVDPMWLKPFESGWKREVVKRASQQGSGRATCDVYYYSPGGRKLRSMPDIIAFLEQSSSDMPLECFTLRRQTIYQEPYEIFREARPSASKSSTSLTSISSASSLVIAEPTVEVKQQKSQVLGRKRKLESLDTPEANQMAPAVKKMKSEIKKTSYASRKRDSQAADLSADSSFVLSDLQELNRELEADRARAEASSTGGQSVVSAEPQKTGGRVSRRASAHAMYGEAVVKEEVSETDAAEEKTVAGITERSRRNRSTASTRQSVERVRERSNRRESSVRTAIYGETKESSTDKHLGTLFSGDGKSLFDEFFNSSTDLSSEMKHERGKKVVLGEVSVTVGGQSEADKLQVVRAAASQALKAYMNKALNTGRSTAARPAAAAAEGSCVPSDISQVSAFLEADKSLSTSSDLAFVEQCARGQTGPEESRTKRGPASDSCDMTSNEESNNADISNDNLLDKGNKSASDLSFSGISSVSTPDEILQVKGRRYGVTRNVVPSRQSPKSSTSTKKLDFPVAENEPKRKGRPRKDKSKETEMEEQITVNAEEHTAHESTEPPVVSYATDLDIVAAIAAGSYCFKSDSSNLKKSSDSTLETSPQLVEKVLDSTKKGKAAVEGEMGPAEEKTVTTKEKLGSAGGKKRGRPSLQASGESEELKTFSEIQKACAKGVLKVLMPRLPVGENVAWYKAQTEDMAGNGISNDLGQPGEKVSVVPKSLEVAKAGSVTPKVCTPKVGTPKTGSGFSKSGASTPKAGAEVVWSGIPNPMMKISTPPGAISGTCSLALNQYIVKKWASRTCGLDCAGRVGIPPSFYCDTCMSAFHPECIGMRHFSYKLSYTCLNCRVMKKDSENLIYTLNNYAISKPVSDNSNVDSTKAPKPSDSKKKGDSAELIVLNGSGVVGGHTDSTASGSGKAGQTLTVDGSTSKVQPVVRDMAVSACEAELPTSDTTSENKSDRIPSTSDKTPVKNDSKSRRREEETDTDPRPHSERLMCGTVLTVPAVIIEAVQGLSKAFDMSVESRSVRITPDMLTVTGVGCRVVLPVDALPEKYTMGAKSPLLFRLVESKESRLADEQESRGPVIRVTLAKEVGV